MGMLSPFRRRPGVLLPAARADARHGFRVLRGRVERCRARRTGVSRQHTGPRDPAVRPHRGRVEITDFAPRFHQYGRMFSPMMLVRQIRRIAGNPRIRVRLRPAPRYGHAPAETTCRSNHIRYAGADLVLRLTTDASITALTEENPFYLEDGVTLLLGPDETVQGAVADVGRRFLEETAAHWREWVRSLGIPS